MNSSIGDKRLLWADSLKGILIILVVFGHAIQEVYKQGCFDSHLWNLIYSFHMPAFMAISGYVNYRAVGGGQKRRLLHRRFQQLMIPFFLWALIRIMINPPYSSEVVVNAFLYPDGSFWFLWVLFFISVIFFIGDWLSEMIKIKQEWVIGAFCVGLALLMVLFEIRILGFQFIAFYFVFYSFGYYLNKYSHLIISKTWDIVLLSILWLVMAWYWNMHKLPAVFLSVPLPQSLMQYVYRFFTAAIAIYVLTIISPKILDHENKWNRMFVNSGKLSLGIYTSHILIMPFVVKGIQYLTSNTYVVVGSAFIVAFVLSWVIVVFLSKYSLTKKLLLGKI